MTKPDTATDNRANNNTAGEIERTSVVEVNIAVHDIHIPSDDDIDRGPDTTRVQ
ncbi:hypothetical protein [Kutzneria sp. CA-103260]|uniref:hypothetical protein n=1 Tax=Kutzneria sp. CA-103260 TaxID=2802641 RepID=UPI001BA4C686|nr:hypothetical protein [Kutzneria sp. CA-103260]QUQ68689.1 hypothetical protein JJ691_64360 [Kutzneria sp. CA-103260]